MKKLSNLFSRLRSKPAFNKFIIRISTAFKILTMQYKHWIIIDITDETLYKLFSNEDFETNTMYHGISPYLAMKMIKMAANSTDDIDLALMKAEFEADVELQTKPLKKDG